MRLIEIPTLAVAFTAAALALGVATPASAVLMSSGGVSGTISTADGNDGVIPIYGTNTRSGFYGANLSLTGAVPATVTVTFLGREAEFNNMFEWDGSTIFQNSSFANNAFSNAGFASQSFLNVVSGLLPFLFSTPNGDAVNGSNNDNTGPQVPNFFLSFDSDGTATSGNSVVLWLDDAKDVDDNHDDMVIRITATPIPLPASVLMLLAALGGLGVLSRRRSATA